MKKDLSRFEKTIQYQFKDKNILAQSITHSSYANEYHLGEHKDNEVLEFLGDSVLGMVVADFLCSKYKSLSEGELSKLKAAVASTTSLSYFAKEIKLPKYLFLGRGEESSGGRKKKTILAGAFEALVAGIYYDGGIKEAEHFITRLLNSFFEKVDVDKFLVDNYKSALQEYFQKGKNGPAPVYKTVKTKGPAHKKNFTVEVSAENKTLAKARGTSIKDAEQKAAQKALKNLLGRRIKRLTEDTFLMKKRRIP